MEIFITPGLVCDIDRRYKILLNSLPFCRFCLRRRHHLIFVCLVFAVVSAFLFVVVAVAIAFSFGCQWFFVLASVAAIVVVSEEAPWIFVVVPNRSATPRPAFLPARIGKLPEAKPICVHWFFHRCFQRSGRHRRTPRCCFDRRWLYRAFPHFP